MLAVAQNRGPAPEAAAPASARTGLVILDLNPAMDDLMTMLVQPRHMNGKELAAGGVSDKRIARRARAHPADHTELPEH
jgi:hypothetical protein